MGAVTAGGRIEVDPEVLLRAGKRVSFIGANLDALSTSLGAALGSGVASGWDPAGAHFGLTYGDLAQQFANTLAKAATAFKFSGVRLEATGYNYKNADASSTIGGGGPAGSVGATPTETKAADTPTGPSGSIVPPPGNWWLIQGMLNAIPVIGSAAGAVMTWPTGDPSLMRLTAAQWKNFATGFSAFNDDLPALKTALSQQHIPEQGKIQECLGDLATFLPELSRQATNIATSTENFANGVQKAQDAIRRLLDRISPEGLWDAVTGVFSGDGLDLLRQVADDVGSVLENFQNEIKGIVGLLGDVSKALGDALDAFQKWVKPALIAAFGEEVGGALAEAVTFYTDIQLGLVNSLIGAVSGIVSLADIDTYKGMAEMAMSVAEDPSTLDDVLLNMGKQFIAYDQLTGDHPGRGVGEAAGNIAQLFMPGGAASKTGSIAKGFRYGSKLLEEGRLPRLSDIPGFGKSPTGLDNLPGAGPGHPPEFTPPRLPDSLANPSAPPHFDPPHETPQRVGGSGGPPAGPPGGGPPDPPGGRPVGPPESGPSHTDGPTPQSPSSGAGEPPRVSEPTAPSAPSHAPSSSDAPAPAAPHAPESPSPASPHETGGQSPSEPGPSPSEHSPAPPEPSGNGVAEPRSDGNYAPNESHQPTSQGHNGPATDGAHAPADQQPVHSPAAESPAAHEPTRTDGGQPHEPTHAPSDANTQPHEPSATTPAPMAGGMPMAPHAGGGVHSPSDSPASRGPSADSTPRAPESKAPQASSPESSRTQSPSSAGPGPSSTPSAPVHPATEHPSARASEAPEARPRPPAPEARGPVGPSHQDPPKPPDPPRPPPTEPRPPDAAPPSDHNPNGTGDDSSPTPGGDHDAPLFDESGAGYPDSYPLPPNSALMPPHDGAFFWSGRDAEGVGIGPQSAGGDGTAGRIADSHNGTTLEGLLERNGIEPPKWSPEDHAAERWWSDVSDMYAGNVSGEVRAVVGSQLRPGNIWETVELPRLMENPAVTRITQIDAETGHATEIFSRHPDVDSGAVHERPSPSAQGAESRSPAGTHDPERGPPEPIPPRADDAPTTPEVPGNEHSPDERQSGVNNEPSTGHEARRADSPESTERSGRPAGDSPAVDSRDPGASNGGRDQLGRAAEPSSPPGTHDADQSPPDPTTPLVNDTSAAYGNEHATEHRQASQGDAPSDNHEAPRAGSPESAESSDRPTSDTPTAGPRDSGGSNDRRDQPEWGPERSSHAPNHAAAHGSSDGHSDDGPTRTESPPPAGDESQHPADDPGTTPESIPPDEIPPLLIREHPYPYTGGILPDFVGEQYPGGPLGSPGVTYLDETARESYRITIRDGIVHDATGRPFDTSSGISAFGSAHNGRAIFVMDEHGNLYASTFQKFREFHHSSLLAGGDVASAGEIIVKNGRIELLTDCSGHYRPGRARTQQVLDQLASQGIVVDPSHVDLTAPLWTA